MTELMTALTAALIAGLVGSAHCLGMCAGLSGLFAMHESVKGLAKQLPMAVAYNAGRLASYAILGVLVAAAGKQVVGLVPALGGPVRFAAGIIMILIGLQIALNWRALKFIERMGAALWQRISPLARGLIPVTNLPRALGLGLLWGLLPCGLVYSVLLIAATASQPTDGALIMLAFGIGTTPAMVATGLGAARLRQWSQNRRARAGLGAIVVVLGLLTLAMPVQKWLVGPDGGGHSHHGHMQGR